MCDNFYNVCRVTPSPLVSDRRYFCCFVKFRRLLLLAESGDEVDAESDVAGTRDRYLDRFGASPLGGAGRRKLPAPPCVGVDGDIGTTTTTTTDARTVQRQHEKSSTKCDTDDDDSVDASVVMHDAPMRRRDFHARGSDSEDSTTSSWKAEMRSLAESKLQIRRPRSDGGNDEDSAAPAQWNLPPSRRIKTTSSNAVSNLKQSGARTSRNVILNGTGGKQLPTATDRFMPISNGVASSKPNANKPKQSAVMSTASSGRPVAKGSTAGAPNVGGSRSARTTPQGSSSPTKDIRLRSKSNTRDEVERTTTATATSAVTARVRVTDVARRTGVNDDVSRRNRTSHDVPTDFTATTARQRGSRDTSARQNAPPPLPTSTKLRSSSQKRPGEIGAARNNVDTSRSQYRSPDRGRTSKRQSEVVATRTSQNMYRSSSASVLPTPRRTASRSPQRPFVPPPGSEQERRQIAHEAFKKRMSYDPSKSAALGRAAVARRTGSRGSLERISQEGGGDSRRSSRGSVSGLSDEEPSGQPAGAVAKFSSSVAFDINVMSQLVESGHPSNSVYYDDAELSTNAVCFCSFFFGLWTRKLTLHGQLVTLTE